jgi:oligoribonuclease
LDAHRKDRLIWLDLEMTGLDPDRQVIMEIGAAVTDDQLQLIAQSAAIAIHLSKAELDGMDAWCVEHHGKSGLTDRCKTSKISRAQAETQIIGFLALHADPGVSPLCGNSIGQDRRFLVKYMPTLNDFFHYRNVDVSSIKELSRRWYPAHMQAPAKRKTHTVSEDIRESIDELRHYRKTIFK